MRKELNIQECDATKVQSLFCSSAHKKFLPIILSENILLQPQKIFLQRIFLLRD